MTELFVRDVDFGERRLGSAVGADTTQAVLQLVGARSGNNVTEFSPAYAAEVVHVGKFDRGASIEQDLHDLFSGSDVRDPFPIG